MPIRLTHNPYQGINAHWNSLLQSQHGGWESFHHDHLTDIARFMNEHLPTGYYASAEKSVVSYSEEEIYLGTSRPDVGVFRSPSAPLAGLVASPTPTYILELPFEEPPYLPSLVSIYDTQSELITRLELLSPANKKNPKDYLLTRQRTRAVGAHLIELDYLHRWRNLFVGQIPDYSLGETDAYPYSITIFDLYEQQIKVYGFDVGSPLPTLILPLKAGENFTLNFDEAYQYTFSKDRRAHTLLDYSQLPLDFESYSPADQAKIQAIMQQVAV